VKSTLTTVDNSAWPLNSLLISQKHRVIYTPIAKNANTSLKRMFVRLSGHPQSDEILAGDVHTWLTSNRTLRRRPILRRRGQEKLLPAQLQAQRTLPHASELLTGDLTEQLKSRYAMDYELWQEALT